VTFARVKSGKSKQELAESLGISKQFMGDIEAGRRNADLELLKRMADVLDCPLVVLQAKRETTRERPGMSPAHKPVRGIAPAP
jgi:transcriptional regulator with XRE-family HTH domain